MLARGPNIVVALSTLRCFPAGIEIGLLVQAHHAGQELFDEVSGFHENEDHLQLNVTYADGATTVAGTRFGDDPLKPPALVPLRTGGTAGVNEATVSATYWLWPLPPAGDLRITCSWPARDIRPVTTTLETGPLLEAANRAVDLWNV